MGRKELKNSDKKEYYVEINHKLLINTQTMEEELRKTYKDPTIEK